VVGLVVGPKGATIKRIQQQTHTYIVTPSRDKEPVFEVTGLPENVEAAKKEIEAHIAIRTGADITGSGSSFGFSRGDDFGFGSFSSSNGHLDALGGGGGGSNKLSSLLTKGVTLQSLLDGGQDSGNGLMTAWSNNGGTDSHDSGIGHSPPFDKGIESSGIWGELNRSVKRIRATLPHESWCEMNCHPKMKCDLCNITCILLN
jgi:RNA-binding protein MEX3